MLNFQLSTVHVERKHTQVVTEINAQGDKQSSEIMTEKWSNCLNNNITQSKCYDKHFDNLLFENTKECSDCIFYT